jgi:putative transposase
MLVGGLWEFRNGNLFGATLGIHRVVGQHTTTDCGNCGARAKHRLPLSQRTYRCEHCGHVAGRDKNSAHVILNRAGFNPAGVDGIRPDRSPSGQAA